MNSFKECVFFKDKRCQTDDLCPNHNLKEHLKYQMDEFLCPYHDVMYQFDNATA